MGFEYPLATSQQLGQVLNVVEESALLEGVEGVAEEEVEEEIVCEWNEDSEEYEDINSYD